MKKLTVFCLILYSCCSFFNLGAQVNEPFFLTKFYVEDAVGHLDSVEIGFDPTANYIYNPSLGELDISTPFDSVFEVRVSHRDGVNSDPNLVLSKRIVGGCEYVVAWNWNCYVAEQIHIFVKAKYQPVTFRWDNTVWRDSTICQRYSFITPDNKVQLIDIENWFNDEDPRGSCLSDTSKYTLFLDGKTDVDYKEFPINLPPAISGDQDSIFGVLFFWYGIDLENDFCNRTIDVDNPLVQSTPSISIYPNPAGDNIHILSKAQKIMRIKMMDASGVMVKDLVLLDAQQDINLETKNMQSGFYFIQIWYDDQRYVTKKCVIFNR